MSGFEGKDIETMVMFGNGADAAPWVEQSSPADVTRHLLFTAAKYGQVDVLQRFISKGDVWLVNDTREYSGWNLYHYAVLGYQRNCNYLLTAAESQIPSEDSYGPKLPSTLEESRETQLDILHALAEGGALPFDPGNFNQTPLPGHPPHPSQMALDEEYNFLEAAYLIDILVILHSDPNATIPTPGLEMIQVSKNKQYRTALHHLMKWSYDRNYLDVLGYCHDRYHSICGDVLRLRPGNLPMFLHAITASNLDVVQLVFDHEEKRPVPDRLMSRLYDVGQDELKRKASALSLACEMTLEGNMSIMSSLIQHTVIGNHLLNISLSDLKLEKVPLALFHERLNSLSLSNNYLTALPDVDEWKCRDLMFLSVEYNRLSKLPPGLFALPRLLNLNAGNNEINEVDISVWKAQSLKTLNLNKNCLTSLPCPKLPRASFEESDSDTQSKKDSSLRVQYNVFGIGHGFVNRGVQRSDDRYKSSDGHILQHLDLSDNMLTKIPEGLPCLAPQLRTLKLSRNKIFDFGTVSDYPSVVKSLELILNNATVCINGASSFFFPHCYQSQHLSSPVSCSHRIHTNLSELHHLNINKNKLTEITLEVQTVSSLASVSVRPTMKLLFPNLKTFSFSNNELTIVPEGIHKLTSLLSLDISNNMGIRKLPLQIHHLKELDGFQYKGISDSIVNELDSCKDIGHIRHYLRAKQTETVSNLRVRLNVIGHFKKGKSTVSKGVQKFATKGTSKSEFFSDQLGDTSKQGIRSDTWPFLKKKLPDNQTMSFCVWEFGGQDEYYPIHQCFLTNRALYLLVWKVTDREHGINGLGIWLRNLQSKAPGSKVIIVGTHIDELPAAERVNMLRTFHQNIADLYGTPVDSNYPTISRIHFVGKEESKLTQMFYTNKYDELADIIYEEACRMEIPKTRDMRPTFHMKVLEEQLPKTYIDIEDLVINLRNKTSIISRSEFCKIPQVKKIISEHSEVDTAMDVLHNRGTVFHFHMKGLEDYYILNPQWWFDACELVVSQENITSLVATGDRSSGILSYDNMVHLFRKKGIEEYTPLVLQFLHQHEVILPIDSASALVPSLLYHVPEFKIASHHGMFPWGSFSIDDAPHDRHSFTSFLPAAANRSLPSEVKIRRTGLILRRMFLLPPISLDFWNRVINLCLQKTDFAKIVHENFNDTVSMFRGDYGQFHQIGSNFHLRWKYWRTGVVLELNHQPILTINSLKCDAFTDPINEIIISDTSQKAKRFQFCDEGNKLIPLKGSFTEVFEVIVPEIILEPVNPSGFPFAQEDLSPSEKSRAISFKLLAKGLEIIDEVLRGYSSDFAEDGIFSLRNMFHVVPCPICFGDRDNRPRHPSIRRSQSDNHHRPRLGTCTRQVFQTRRVNRLSSTPEVESGRSLGSDIIVFSIGQCVEAAVGGVDCINCPTHGDLNLKSLTPDILFNDLLELKLNISCLSNPPGNDGTPVGQGCFGIVYHKLLNHDQDSFDKHVALKEFVVDEMMSQENDTNEVKKYSDMRYELNKLSVLSHDFIVEFVGVVARPPSFVLEWAPLMSLEKIRVRHERQQSPICPVSLYITLLQVLDGLHYLHAPPVGIIHSDLKLSNILAFEFPEPNHTCCHAIEDRGRCVKAMPELSKCGISVKLGDMGVCVNPAGLDAGDNVGVKRFAPECNNPSEKKLTEKVDIFCLGICVYELLTLKGLPPEDKSELEYRRDLAKGWRPLFHLKDVSYPLLLNLFMEQCWEQDYTKRPSALILKQFLEGGTGISVKNKFEVLPGKEAMSHCLDSYMCVADNQVVTAFYMVPDCQPLTIYLAICEEGNNNKVVQLEAVEDDETKKPFFKATVINQCADQKVTAIYATPDQDAVLGYQDGRVVYVKSKGGFPQITPSGLCNRELNHGAVNFIHFLKEEELIVTGFTNGVVHLMKVQTQHFSEWFLKGFYCCTQESPDIVAVGCYAVLNNPSDSEIQIWFGCSHSHIETWTFPVDTRRWRIALLKKMSKVISLRHPSFTPHSSHVCNMSVTPDQSSVFALIGDSNKYGVIAICQVDAVNKTPLRHWQCDIGRISCFSATATNLTIGTITGHCLVYSRSDLEKEDVYQATNNIKVLSHAKNVSQIAVFDGTITPQGYTSMFNVYLGTQSQSVPCRFIVSVGRGVINPVQFSAKAPKNSASERDRYCVNVWAV